MSRYAVLPVLVVVLLTPAVLRGHEPDLILVEGKVITVDEAFSIARALAVREGRIVAVGTTEEIEALAGPATRRVDLAGATVTPGFVDGHPHLYGMEDVALTGVESIQDIVAVIEREAERREAGEWILVEPPGEPPYHFHMPERLAEGRWPTRVELDAAAPRNPVYVKSSPFHERPTSLFNSRALAELGITRQSGPIEGVEIGRLPDGTPTGEIIGNLSYFSQSPLRDRLWALAPPRSLAEQLAELRRDMASYNAGGVTAIYEGHGMPASTTALYTEAWNRGELTVRAYMVNAVDQFQPLEGILRELDGLAVFRGPGFGDDRLKIGGIGLIFGDNVGFGAGFMRRPYVGHHGHEWQGLQLIDDEKLYAVVRAAAERGLRVNMQASGGRAIDKVLAAFSRVNEAIPITDRRFVLEHCQFPSSENMKEAQRLGVIPTTVTNFLWGQGNAYLRYYGPELTQQAVPVRSWLEHGVPVAQSTDYGPNGAMFTLWQSIARQNGWTGETLGPQESLTREQAIRIYTMHGARLAFWEDDIGSLEEGKLADLVILDRDILTVPLDEIRETRVLVTLLGGEAVYGSLDALSAAPH